MLKTLEKSGKTEDAAVSAALLEAGLERDDVSLEIVQRAKSGFFGIGAVPAIIKISWEVPDEKPVAPIKPKAEPKPEKAAEAKPEKAVEAKPAKAKQPEQKKQQEKKPAAPKKAVPENEPEDFKKVRDFLTGLFEHMDVKADIAISRREGGGINVILSGKSIGTVIGRRGETLDAIQHLANYALNHGSDKHLHINIDAEGYRSKREDSLVKLAEKMAEKTIKYKRSMTLEPMNSYERHIIHAALQDYEGVSTNSVGTEPNRRVVVNYEGKKATQSNKPKTREWA